jgi:hypothetical protein
MNALSRIFFPLAVGNPHRLKAGDIHYAKKGGGADNRPRVLTIRHFSKL